MRVGATRARVLLIGALAMSGCHRGRLLARGDAAAVVVIAPDAAAPTPVTEEIEPNDSPAGAQPIVVTEAAAIAVRGALVARGDKADVDVFRFVIGTVTDGGVPPLDAGPTDGGVPLPALTLSLDLAPAPELACLLQIVDVKGQPVVSSTAPAGERCAIANAPVTAGATVVVRVRGAGKRDAAASASYALTARVQTTEAGDEREPNDQVAATTPAENTFEGRAAVEERAGFFGWPHDVDVWTLPLGGWPADALVTVELEGVEGVEAGVTIADLAGHAVATARGRSGERVVLRQLALPAAADGTRAARIVVKAERGSRADRRYVLRVRQDAAEPGGEREPNDDPAHATALPDGVAHGYLTSGDVDVYRVELDRPVELEVAASAVERVDLAVALLTADGAVIVSADARRRGEGERIANAFVAQGPVFVRVSARRGDANPDQPYTLEVHPSEPAPNGEREPNDVRERATPLALATPATGLLSGSGETGDVDLWAVTLPPDAATLELAVRGPRGTASEVTVETRTGRTLTKLSLAAGEEARRSLSARAEPMLFVRWRARAARGGRSAEASSATDRYELVVGATP